MSDGILLAGDIGGTNVRLARIEREDRRVPPVDIRTYPSRSFNHLTDAIREYLGDEVTSVARAAFGIAGPVTGSVVKTTNLPWVVDADELSGCMGGARVTLVNDLVAAGYGVNQLAASDCLVMREGAGDPPRGGSAVLLAAGTGLGMSILHWTADGWEPQSSEGGHAGLAPRTDVEARLVAYLRERFGAVYWELAVSGPGIANIFDFVCQEAGTTVELDIARFHGDRSAAITDLALHSDNDAAGETLRLFVGLYASVARNLALIALATGGVYLGGGIAPRVFPHLGDEYHDIFRDAFIDSPAYRDLLVRIPVTVITDELTGLKGAGLLAGRGLAVGA